MMAATVAANCRGVISGRSSVECWISRTSTIWGGGGGGGGVRGRASQAASTTSGGVATRGGRGCASQAASTNRGGEGGGGVRGRTSQAAGWQTTPCVMDLCGIPSGGSREAADGGGTRLEAPAGRGGWEETRPTKDSSGSWSMSSGKEVSKSASSDDDEEDSEHPAGR